MSASGNVLPNAACGYSYEQLEGDTDIRLLNLSAGTDEDGLVCDLITYPLAECPPFDALSYVWGAADERHKISCEGKDLYITPNLGQALRQVRYVDRPRCIWADQICINQQDPVERGHQVSLMADIYSRAHKVVACFGGTREEGRQFSGFMKELTLYMETVVERQGGCNKVYFIQHPDSLLEVSGFRTLQNIFQHTYFTRLWVIQELGFANMPVVLVGGSEISWATLLECSLFLRRDDGTSYQKLFGGHTAHHQTLTDWPSQNKRHWFVPEGGNCSFLTLLDQTRYLEASDERDRIFAFLGHPTARMSDGATVVSPDYTTDLDSCLYEFAKQWIVKSGDLTILSAVDIHRPDKYRRLPSWVPTWQGQKQQYLNANQQHLNMTGDLGFEAGTRLNGPSNISGSLLTVRGVLLDSVSLSLPFHIHQDEASESLESLESSVFGSLRRAWTIVESHDPLFTRGMSRLFAFIQTVTALNSLREYLSDHGLAFEQLFLGYLQHQEMANLDPIDEHLFRVFPIMIAALTKGRHLMISRDHGIMGLVPETTIEGDFCCIVAQCKAPLVLRRTSDDPPHYQVIGEAYLHGYMRGEIAKDLETGDAHVTDLTLC